MRSLAHRLLFVIGLLTVAGCALNNRNFSQQGYSASRANSSLGAPSSSRLAFKPPSQLVQAGQLSDDPSDDDFRNGIERSTMKGSESAGWQAGHSIDLNGESGASGQTSSRAGVANFSNRPSGPNGNQFKLTPDSKADPTVSGPGRLATKRIDNAVQQTSDSFVQLQGLEFEDSASSDPSKRNSQIVSNGLASNQSSIGDPQQDFLNEQIGANVPNWSGGRTDIPAERIARNRTPNNQDSATTGRTVRSDAMPPNVAEQLPPLPWQSELEKLIARVEQDLAQSKPEHLTDPQSEYVRRQVQLRILYLMSQRQQEALTAIPGIDPSQQEFWQHVLLAMSNSFDTNQFPDASIRAGQTITPLSAALREIRDSAPLAIKNMGFCRKISYFGNYERFPRNEFTPGQEVLLYTEIENFVSSPTADGEYRTSLKSLVEIVDPHGKVVWTKGFAPTEDFCRNPRRDYFHNYQFHIPKDLSTGTYSLKLTIEDELSHKRNSNSLNFVLK